MFSTIPFDICSSLYENPTSSHNSFLDNFPSSLLDDEELLFDHLLHHHQSPYHSMITNHNNNNNIQNPNSNSMNSSKDPHVKYPQKEEELCNVATITTATTTAKGEGGANAKRVGVGVKRQSAGPTARRRTGKKDRHSKICTAQGPRDRRMRLSLQIARKFFDLQDMLGFDKASKTIEWLFSKSKSAIRDLTSTLPPHKLKGSLVISTTTNNNNKLKGSLVNLEDLGGVGSEPKLMRNDANPGHSNPFAKESREKARARARQRTLEKKRQKELMMLETNPNCNNSSTTSTPNNNDSNHVSKFGSSSTPETVDQENQMSNSVSIIERLLGSDSSASSSSIYDDCSFLGCTGNWVMDSLRMYPSDYGAITGVDELQVILRQQNPKSESSAGLSGMHFQSSCPENQFSSSSRG